MVLKFIWRNKKFSKYTEARFAIPDVTDYRATVFKTMWYEHKTGVK